MHHHEPPPQHRAFARAMRLNATKAERLLWQQLKDGKIGGVKFRRQVPLLGYILDFISFDQKLIIEVDGAQHADNVADQNRDQAFAKEGFKTSRFWNSDIEENMDFVVKTILIALGRPY
jgi:very-short-patch-repair endonuclease